jgi:hypothetical protein
MTNQEIMAQRKAIIREMLDMPEGKDKEAKRLQASDLLRQLKNVTVEDVYGFTVQ